MYDTAHKIIISGTLDTYHKHRWIKSSLYRKYAIVVARHYRTMVAYVWDANKRSDRGYAANKLPSPSKTITLCAFPHRLQLVLRVSL